MNIIDIFHTDDLVTVIRKCNENFRQLAFDNAKTAKIQNVDATEALADMQEQISDIARDIDDISYASSPSVGGNADMANAILYGHVDAGSIATQFTVTVPGLTMLVDGTCVMLRNGVVTSAAGFTIDVNGLGAKPVYSNMAAATQETTIFNVNYTMLFVYDSTRVSGGAWVCYRGYDSNTNTIGYQLRTNNLTLPASDKTYRYRLLFTSADGTKLIPANTSTSTNATTARTANTKPIDPFGRIVYYGSTSVINADSNFGASSLWQQYAITLGYSFNSAGGTLALTFPAPVYLRCQPQADDSAVMEDVTQSLPTTDDGKIYILLGIAYSATAMELTAEHPVYEYRDGAIRAYVGSSAYPPVGSYVMADQSPSYPGTTWTQAGNIYVSTTDTVPVWKRVS